jgi:integration host factor subunit alpha
VLHHMCHSLSDGKNVKISGFGSFILRDKGERVGRNPKTGIEVAIAPRRVMTFRASQIMRDRIAR